MNDYLDDILRKQRMWDKEDRSYKRDVCELVYQINQPDCPDTISHSVKTLKENEVKLLSRIEELEKRMESLEKEIQKQKEEQEKKENGCNHCGEINCMKVYCGPYACNCEDDNCDGVLTGRCKNIY